MMLNAKSADNANTAYLSIMYLLEEEYLKIRTFRDLRIQMSCEIRIDLPRSSYSLKWVLGAFPCPSNVIIYSCRENTFKAGKRLKGARSLTEI